MIVVDTNVLVYRWLGGRDQEAMSTLVGRDADWAAPPLWRSEFRNAMAVALRAGRIGAFDAAEAIRLATRCLLGGEHSVSDEAVLRLVAASPCTAYDCEFVALAEALDTVLVTEDRALLAAFPQRCRNLRAAARG